MIVVNSACEVCGNAFSYEKEKPSRPDQRACSTKCAYELRKRTRRIVHEPVEKVCLTCKQAFLDTSKKKLVDRCKKCVNEGMVATRKNRVNYVRTDSQNEKLSKMLTQKYESGWNPNTDEHKA